MKTSKLDAAHHRATKATSSEFQSSNSPAAATFFSRPQNCCQSMVVNEPVIPRTEQIHHSHTSASTYFKADISSMSALLIVYH